MKTVWQKVYSFFGFWTYILHTEERIYKVLYWCAVPGYFVRKFDLFTWDITEQERSGLRKTLLRSLVKGIITPEEVKYYCFSQKLVESKDFSQEDYKKFARRIARRK